MSWHTKENYDLSEFHPRKQPPNGHGQHMVDVCFIFVTHSVYAWISHYYSNSSGKNVDALQENNFRD